MSPGNTAVLSYGGAALNTESLVTALFELGLSHPEMEVCDSAVVVLDAQGEEVFPGLFPMLQNTLSSGFDSVLLVSLGEEAGAHARAGATRGLRGLVRTLSQELLGTTVRLVEFTGCTFSTALVQQVVFELHRPEQWSVCQYMEQQRFEIGLIDEPWPATSRRGAGSVGFGESERDALKVGAERVIVAVGGGRGITAQCIQMLAGDRSPRVYLTGSTPPPRESFLRQFDECKEKTALIAQLASKSSSPSEIERTARQILAQREILETEKVLRQSGARVSYHQVDSTSADSIGDFVRDVGKREAAVDIFVYGAGMTIDRRFGEVTCDDVRRVMSVKVGGLDTYLSYFDNFSRVPEVAVAFGSVAASAGNPGQSAYSIANDAMEGVLWKWSECHAGSRAVTINWGPWARDLTHPGMVTPGLDRAFAQRGLDLLSPEQAVRAFLTELAWGISDVNSVTLVPETWSVWKG